MSKDYREVDQPKADNLFSDPNLLSELLDDLEAYEEVAKHNDFTFYQSEHGDRMKKVKHTPFDTDEDAPEADIKKKAEKQPFIKEEDVDNLYDNPSELDELDNDEDFQNWLGVRYPQLVKNKKEDAQKFPMDDEAKND